MTKSHVLGYFVVSGLLGLGGGGASEAAPLLGFTDTPPPPTNTATPPPTATSRPGGGEKKPSGPLPTATLIPILPISGAEAGRSVAPWVFGGIALFLGWVFHRVGRQRKDREFRSSPPCQE
jgi:hypothetical protein